MVLVSFVLVVVAAITLVIGLLQSGLGIIYVSIACSLAAGVVLLLAVLRGRPAPGGAVARPASSAAPAQPAPAQEWSAPTAAVPPQPERQPVAAGADQGSGSSTIVAVDERDDRTEALDQVEVDDAAPSGDDFPIHDYDRLRATEVLPMLAELSDAQLEAVEEHERGGKNRAMILKRIEARKQSRKSEAWDADDEGWEAAAALAPESVEPPAVEPVEPQVAEPSGGGFPIPDYDGLRALEVLGRLPDLTVSELQLVRRREEDGFRRAMVLNRIDRLIEEAPPEPPPVVVIPAKRRAPAATKVPATRRTVRKAAAVDIVEVVPEEPVRASAPAKAAPAKRQPRSVKAVAAPPTAEGAVTGAMARTRKAAPARKASAAKVGPVEKAVAPPTRAPAKRAAATKATTAKKAPPVRRAAKRR